MSKPIYYSCVVDSSPTFYYQTWHWVNSLLDLGRVTPEQIFVHHTPEVERFFLDEISSLGINTVLISRFGDGKYCNKIAQLDTKAFEKAECVFFMDTDMIILEDISSIYKPGSISGKVVDFANPSLELLNNLFDLAGFHSRPPICSVDCDTQKTFQNNLNGGLYVVPGEFICTLRTNWKKWALWLIDNIALLKAEGKEIHVDQISFSMASFEMGVSINELSSKHNYPLHIKSRKTGNPSVLHYHRNLSHVGLIHDIGDCDDNFKIAVDNANNLISDHFNNKIFWSYRYSQFPEIGSGVGSRNENLAYKRDLLVRYGLENSPSILDVGCGDLEVIHPLSLKNYTGIDVSPYAIDEARDKRPDLEFIHLNGDVAIPSADTVLCFEVLIHQQSKQAYNDLIGLLVSKTTNKLIVSGYVNKDIHHTSNHMLNFHESLIDSLANCNKFSSINIIGHHSDVDIVLAEI